MAVRRIVPNLFESDLAGTRSFYADIFELDLVMDLGWISTLAAPGAPLAQLSILERDTEDGLDPFISIDDDVDDAYRRARARGHDVLYELRNEPWGVRRFMIRDPAGRTVNVLQHLDQ